MTYKIKIRPKALKFIEKQDKVQRLRIYKAIYSLPNGDVKKWQAVKMNIGLEFGNYRIIYEIFQNELIILITKADTRGQIYK